MKLKITAFLAFLMLSFHLSLFAEAIVSGIKGKATIVRGGSPLTLSMGTPLKKGDILKTEAGGQVDVSLNGAAGVRFLEGSEVVLRDIEPENTQLDLKIGNIIANLKKKLSDDQDFKVETPTAVLAVRGTQFWGQVATPSAVPVTTFAVRKGEVEIFARQAQKSFKLSKGQALVIPYGETAPKVREASKQELTAISQAEEIRIR
jgi:hypothetical protein